MLRRLLPLLLALSAGLVALGVGLVALYRIFTEEQAAARDEVQGRVSAVQAYASEALRADLLEALERARAQVTVAAEDPLVDASDLYLRDGSTQRLPRLTARPSRDGGAVEEALRQLASDGPGPEGPDEPWSERLRLGRQLRAALAARDDAQVTRVVREHLRHRVQYQLSTVQDAASTLVALEDLQRMGSPDPTLLHGLLRDGLRGASGSFLPGLQRLLLQDPGALSASELELLAPRVAALCDVAGVRTDDFLARVRERPAEEPPPALSPDGPTLAQGRWLVERAEDGTVRGGRVSLEALRERLTALLRARGLLTAEEALTLPALSAHVPLSAVALGLESRRAARARVGIDRRHALKTALLAVSGLLAVAISGLALLLRQRQQRYVELKSDFVATVSHELRTPLASMRVMAETLERRLEGSPVTGTRDYPARIVGEVDRLSFLVENILAFNRIDKGRWVARRSQVPLSEVVSRAVAEATSHATAQVQLATRNLGAVVLDADADLLVILFGNLARNACAYNLRDPVHLAIAAREEPDAWVVEVTDNGVGIPPEERAQVFREFYRVQDGVTRPGGSGLGLAICRRIMELHQGQIRVASSSMEGTTFELRFPRPS